MFARIVLWFLIFVVVLVNATFVVQIVARPKTNFFHYLDLSRHLSEVENHLHQVEAENLKLNLQLEKWQNHNDLMVDEFAIQKLMMVRKDAFFIAYPPVAW